MFGLNQFEQLPIAYFLILVCVVCANVLAKFLGHQLIGLSSGHLKRLLTKNVAISVTGDSIHLHFFEQTLIERLRLHLVVHWGLDYTRWMMKERLKTKPVSILNFQVALYPQIYWSGCPPNAA